MESLTGVIERVTFHNPENGFAVLRVRQVGQKELITVVGQIPQVVEGEHLEASGDWTRDRTHGLQFKAEHLHTLPPHSPEGIRKFLASGLINGIGPRTAELLVERFGDETLAMLDEQPDELRQIKGIGPRKLERIVTSWREHKASRHVVIFFQELGVSAERAIRIHKTYGDQTLAIVQQNPYQLVNDVTGFGFLTADALAQRLGLDRQSPFRARAAVRHVLQELSGKGHCAYPEAAVVGLAMELTGIDRETVTAAIEVGRREEELVREPWNDDADGAAEEPWLYLKPLFLAELGVARALRQLQDGRHPLAGLAADETVQWVERRIGLDLSATQRDAVRQMLASKVLVITGGPGVGKTTLVRALLEVAARKGLGCALCAPTGRAAKRLSETTGREAKTIHRLLEFEPAFGDFGRHRDNPLATDFVIVDETSMVDVFLMNQLLRAVPPHACLVLVGDVDQLPSVGPGTVLADIIRSGVVPTTRLTHVFRQARHSWIIQAAHQVNAGEEPLSAPAQQGDFYIVEAATPDQTWDRLLTMVRDRIPARFGLDPVRDIQILTPMNRYELGTQTLNARLQEALNPSRGHGEIRRLATVFRPGDKVIQTVNNYQKEVFNGDLGRIAHLDAAEQELTVDFDGRRVPYALKELEELALAYALTVHKAQGSEYPAVIVPLHLQHSVLLQRNLLYTAITRGKQLVVLVGQQQALARAVRRQDTARRYAALCRRLQAVPRSG